MSTLLAFVPSEFYLPLLVFAGLAWTIGARRLAGGMVALVLVGSLLPMALDPLLDMLPAWMLVLILVMAVFALFRWTLNMALGKGAADHVVGSFASDAIRFVLAAPFRGVLWLIRRLLAAR